MSRISSWEHEASEVRSQIAVRARSSSSKEVQWQSSEILDREGVPARLRACRLEHAFNAAIEHMAVPERSRVSRLENATISDMSCTKQ